MQLWLILSLIGICAMIAAQHSRSLNILRRAFAFAGG